jgi:hypothetical protein
VSDWVIVRHAVAIAGRVTEAQTGKPVSGARVRITDGPPAFTKWLAARAKEYGRRWAAMDERPDRALSRGDGHFHFLDLPDGTYSLEATLPGSGSRFGTAEAAATVSRDAEGHINLAAAAISLPATTIKGQITGQDDAPVVMAEVRVKGSGERVFTDTQGRYLLGGLEAGERRVDVAAPGFQPASSTATLGEAGALLTLDVVLTPVAP